MFMIILLCYMSLNTILQPRVQYPHDAGPSAASAVAGMYMFAVSLYAVAMAYIASNVSHDPYSYKIELVAAVAFLDTFLLIIGAFFCLFSSGISQFFPKFALFQHVDNPAMPELV